MKNNIKEESRQGNYTPPLAFFAPWRDEIPLMPLRLLNRFPVPVSYQSNRTGVFRLIPGGFKVHFKMPLRSLIYCYSKSEKNKSVELPQNFSSRKGFVRQK
jgi:hypothetical protein